MQLQNNQQTYKRSSGYECSRTSYISSAVRIFGTQKQIDTAFEDICTLTGLNLDECYTYEIEKPGSFHYNKEQNKVIAKKLMQYKEAYKINKRAIILNLR